MASIEVEALKHYGEHLGSQYRIHHQMYAYNELDRVIKKLLDKGATEEAARLTEDYT